MSNKVNIRKNLIYKSCELGQYGVTLQDQIDQVLKLKSKAVGRREELGGEGSDLVRRVISKVRRQDGMLFGQLLMYQVGKDMAFVVEDESADDFEVESSNPGTNQEGKRREVLESALYFGLLDNHVIVLQSRALRSRELENHFNWLLRECTNILSEKYSVCLSDKPSEKARKVIEKFEVKSVRVGTPLVAEEQKLMETVAVNTAKKQFTPAGNGFAALKAFMGDHWPETISLEETLDEANLEVMLHVRYKKKTTKNGHQILGEISRACRHMEPEDTIVDTAIGPTLKGQDLKLTGHVSIGSINGVIDYEDLYRAMHTWLEARIKEGSVL